jgi:aryl-alcohol dehydrogenase-like predicted oxidoreductase/nucleoside-diphosphate-sugar epimerase
MGTLFVGGGFFVGYEMVARLLRDGHDLTVLALDPPAEEFRARVEWLRVDRNDAMSLRKHLARRRFDIVVDNVAYNPAQVEKLLAALDGRVDRFLLTSTVDLYGKRFPKAYAEHQAKLDPSDQTGATGNEHYLRGKRGCEKAVMASGIPWTVIRPAVVTGRRDNQSCAPVRHRINLGEPSRSLFYPSRILGGGPILVRQDDEAAFNLIWVADLANAVALLLRTNSAAGQAYNVAGDEVWTSEHLVMSLARVAERVPEIVRVPPALLAKAGLQDYAPPYGRGPVWSVVDNSKLRRLGWAPSPPDRWMADLMETPPAASARGWYERRMQEVALAHYARRHHPTILPSARPSPPVKEHSFVPVGGRISADGSASWVRAAIAGEDGTVPSDVRWFRGRSLSSVGIGTWMGDTSAATDVKYIDAITHAVERGINVIDSAINYRHMQAERCVGRALKRLEASGIDRSAVLVCTKGGYITNDAANNLPSNDYVKRFYVDKGLISKEEARRRHSIAPKFIEYSLRQSLNNLCVRHIDVYYLHNPEIALEAVGKDAFYQLLSETFRVIEDAVAAGRVGCYGLATWHGLRVAPSDKKHISLARAIAAAQAVAGDDHHFWCAQMPFNALDQAAYANPSQTVCDRLVPPLEAAGKLGLYCFTSATLGQAQRLQEPTIERLRALAPGLQPRSAMLLFAKSAPGVGTALAGMRELAHVDEAVRVAATPELDPASLAGLRGGAPVNAHAGSPAGG